LSRSGSSRRPALRGLFSRFFGLLFGLIIAAALIVGMQLPLLHPKSEARITLKTISPSSPTTPLQWPSVGSAALDIPALGVLIGHNNAVVPIASLTKMMTAYVALQKLPLTIGETGPCHIVTEDDVLTYDQLVVIDESSVPVVVGEQLCEIDLLNGLLVHSAGNYAVMLANMAVGSNETFIADMNQEATTLGLTGTYYADVTGYSSQSVSTALDQARLATLLMKSPLVRSIVDQQSVTLPFAGTVTSYTPDVGYDNVIGVKSGRTAEAGGCDVMAMTFQDGTAIRVVYAVVLGQQGGDLLTPAGEAALALANSAVASRVNYTFQKNQVVGSISWGTHHVAIGLTSTHEVWWWPAQGAPQVSAVVRTFTKRIHRGEQVGELRVDGFKRHVFVLRALGSLAPPTLVQRLR
jgi:serine-type D-Ala-D-Ala carboxypeptidase (penicillin-binding protein 5/6)